MWKRIDEKEYHHWLSMVLKNEGSVCKQGNSVVYSIGSKEFLKKREYYNNCVYLKNCDFIGETE